MNVKANAKINLSLDIIGTDERGYHRLRMVMQSLKLCDDIEITPSEDNGIYISIDDRRGEGGGYIPADRNNLMYKAAELMQQSFGIKSGVRIRLIKRIPSEAGLAGGSSDAAAVIRGMNELFGLGRSMSELSGLSVGLGADIPYCLTGGTALAEGIGERLTPIDCRIRSYVLLIKPRRGMSTPKAYAAYDKLNNINTKCCVCGEHIATDELVKALENGDCTAMYEKIGNVLEQPVIIEVPLIERIKADLMENGAKASAMTGSGSVVYGLFSDRKIMHNAGEKIRSYDYFDEISDLIETEFI